MIFSFIIELLHINIELYLKTFIYFYSSGLIYYKLKKKYNVSISTKFYEFNYLTLIYSINILLFQKKISLTTSESVFLKPVTYIIYWLKKLLAYMRPSNKNLVKIYYIFI